VIDVESPGNGNERGVRVERSGTYEQAKSNKGSRRSEIAAAPASQNTHVMNKLYRTKSARIVAVAGENAQEPVGADAGEEMAWCAIKEAEEERGK
jgi:hypothetical protein